MKIRKYQITTDYGENHDKKEMVTKRQMIQIIINNTNNDNEYLG